MAEDAAARARRNLLRRLDAELRRRGVVTPHERELRERDKRAIERRRFEELAARQRSSDARAARRRLYAAIQSEGGIRPNRDYSSRQIPSALRARPGRGLAPDEMADVLRSHGYHFDGDVALFTAIERHRESADRAQQEARRRRPVGGIETVCMMVWRNRQGHYARHPPPAASGPAQQCIRIERTGAGRFRRKR